MFSIINGEDCFITLPTGFGKKCNIIPHSASALPLSFDFQRSETARSAAQAAMLYAIGRCASHRDRVPLYRGTLHREDHSIPGKSSATPGATPTPRSMPRKECSTLTRIYY